MTSIYKRAGRRGWTVQYRDPSTGKTLQKSRRTKAAAEQLADDARAKARALDGLAEDQRFELYATEWLKAAATALKRSTVTSYESALRLHLLPAFGSLWLREITMPRVKAFVVEKRQGGLSKKSVSHLKGVLHAILEHARGDGIIAANPASYRGKSKILRLTPTRAEKRLRKVKAMDAEQLRRFLAAAERSPEPVWHPFFYTVFAGALRVGEALALEPQHADLPGLKLSIDQARSVFGEVETTKSGEEAQVDLMPGCARVLRKWLLRRPASRWLFPAADGKALDHHAAGRAFARVLKAAGLPSHFTPHSLRHTCATLLLLQGESVQYVQAHLRHSTIALTVDTYGSWLPRGDQACVRRLEERVFDVSGLSATQDH